MPKELREAACGTRERVWLQELDHRDLSSIALWAVYVCVCVCVCMCVRARAGSCVHVGIIRCRCTGCCVSSLHLKDKCPEGRTLTPRSPC